MTNLQIKKKKKSKEQPHTIINDNSSHSRNFKERIHQKKVRLKGGIKNVDESWLVGGGR